jgi:transposase
MQVLNARCAGLDVHKKTVVACVMLSQSDGQVQKHTQSFGTMTPDLLALSDWLKGFGVTQVAMESTGVYWCPIYRLLEESFQLLVINAMHIKRMPGRKTDVSDAEWIADLLRHGLLAASFVPPRAQRDLRELTRHRTSLMEKRSQAINEIHRTLEGTNIKLTSVATDITGMSATLMLQALLTGQVTDPKLLADLAIGKLRRKIPQLEKALQGKVEEHHRLILAQLLSDIELFDEQALAVSLMIGQRLKEQEELIQRLDEIPGVARRTAEVVLAELGTDMSRFPSDRHAAAWAGLCPSNKESGGRRFAARSRQGNKALKRSLAEAAMATGKTKDTYLGAQYRRIGARRGKKRGSLAVAHSILRICYHMIKNQSHYKDLGPDYFDRRNEASVTRRLVKRLEGLGYTVQLKKDTAT